MILLRANIYLIKLKKIPRIGILEGEEDQARP